MAPQRHPHRAGSLAFYGSGRPRICKVCRADLHCCLRKYRLAGRRSFAFLSAWMTKSAFRTLTRKPLFRMPLAAPNYSTGKTERHVCYIQRRRATGQPHDIQAGRGDDMSAALNLAAVQSNLRQLGHDVSQEAIVHMLKDLDLSRLLGQLPPHGAVSAGVSAQMQQSTGGSSAQVASEDAAQASEQCRSDSAARQDTERIDPACSSLSSDSRGSSSASQSFSHSPVDKLEDRLPYAYDFSADSTSPSGSCGHYSMFSSDVSHAQTQAPDPDEMTDGSSIFQDEDEEEDDGGYYLSSHTADLVRASRPLLGRLQEFQP